MSEHLSETAFLRHIILYEESDGCRKLEKTLAQVQQDLRCVKRLAAVTLLFPVLAIGGLAYGVILHENFPFNGAELVCTVLCELGLASLLCLAGFVVLLTVYRKKMNRLRKECRQLIIRLLESHWGKPHIATSPSHRRVLDDREAFQGATEVSGYPESASLI
jgi:hypothetical protein